MHEILSLDEHADLYQEAVLLHEKIDRENSHIAHINGLDMGYLEFGEKNAVPLIWAHGSGSTSFEMIGVQAGLIKAGYRLIAIDYRGHGKTQDNLTDQNTSIYHIADDIAGLMDYLDIEAAVIGGLSKGGWIATAFYDAYPDRVLGLLLEDGGSFSSLRLADETHLGKVSPHPSPYSKPDIRHLFDRSVRFDSRFQGLMAILAAYSSAIQNKNNAFYIAWLLSFLRLESDGKWVHHCDCWRYFFGDHSGRDIGKSFTGRTYYSHLPIMQQSQELMIPAVVFRNLSIPVHIIDPNSPTDWLPVKAQNQELQSMFPEWIVHEVYDYEHSPHEAHIERPERFIESATQLLARVKEVGS